MLLVIMLQRGAVVEVIAEGGLHVETELRADEILCPCSSIDRPLPRLFVLVFYQSVITQTFLQHYIACNIDLEAPICPELPAYSKRNTEIMQLLIVGCIIIIWHAELGVEIGVADAAKQRQTRFQLVIQAQAEAYGKVVLRRVFRWVVG